MADILVVDSDRHIRALYQFMFPQHTVHQADSVSEALNCLAHQSVDLVVTEWEFPEGTAQKLLDCLEKSGDAPVILISAFQDLVPPLPSIVTWRFDKPFSLHDVRLIVGQLLSIQESCAFTDSAYPSGAIRSDIPPLS